MSIPVLVEMTLGTDRGRWWADPDFGSDLWILRQSGKTGPELEKDVRREVERALAWLIADGIAKEIVCETEIAGRVRINYRVTVTKPEGGEELVSGVWNGL